MGYTDSTALGQTRLVCELIEVPARCTGLQDRIVPRGLRRFPSELGDSTFAPLERAPWIDGYSMTRTFPQPAPEALRLALWTVDFRPAVQANQASARRSTTLPLLPVLRRNLTGAG